MSSSVLSTSKTSSKESIFSATVASTTPSSRAYDAKKFSASTPSSSSKRTVVTTKRKEELLLEARAERKRWIRTVPLPYDPRLLAREDGRTPTDTSIEDYDNDNVSHHSKGGLKRFRNCLVFGDRLSRDASALISELYSIDSGTLERDSDEKHDGGEDSQNDRTDMPSRPLTMEELAERVDRLTKPFLEDEKREGNDESPASIGDKLGDTPKLQSSDADESDAAKDTLDDTYEDVRAAYEEFTTAMLLPESAVTLQGMKNFVWQFPTIVSGLTKNDDDNDKLIQNMALAVNSHIQSSYESLATKSNSNNSMSTNSDAQGQSQPNMDRRSLESFLYGQVKIVIDVTIDRILGKSTLTSLTNSPFLMTQDLFDKRLEELQFLQPSHLELACLDDDIEDTEMLMPQTKVEDLLEIPIKALQSMRSFYSPYEKLCRVLDVYHGVNAVLKKASKGLPMADDIISGMILVIVKAAANLKESLRNLLRDLHFVENFATQEYKRVGQGEMEYAFTSLYGAVYFLQGVELNFQREKSDGGNKGSNNRLCISNEELRRGLEKSRALATKKNTKWNAAAENDDGKQPKGLISRRVDELMGANDADGTGIGTGSLSSFVPIQHQLTVREVRAARLRGESLNLEWALRQPNERHETGSATAKGPNSSPSKSMSRSVFVPHKHTFLGVRPESIKMSDLPRLLAEYTKLVLANEQLLGEQQWENNRLLMERKRLRDEKHRRTLGEQALLS